MAENPFTKYTETEYKQYAMACLKDLKYLDYELIEEDVRSAARDKHKDEINEKENQIQAEKQDEDQSLIDPELKEAKIDCTQGMLEKILADDDDATKLKSLLKFNDYFAQHETNIEEMTIKFQQEMKILHREKKRTVLYCEQVLKEAEKQAELDSIHFIEEFKRNRKHKFRELNEDDEQFDAYEHALMQDIDVLEDDLMGVEMKMQDSLAVATVEFQDKVKQLNEKMKANIQSL